jgi:pSer/pThr/pTyr-binding forkhead associated (FHA) protein
MIVLRKDALGKLFTSYMRFLFYLSVNEEQRATVGNYGSDPPVNCISIEEMSVSNKQAELFIQRDKITNKKRFYLRDLKSTHGTLLHQQGLQVQLGNRDRSFQIANSLFVLRIIVKKDTN